MDQHPWLDAVNQDLLILVIPAALCLLAGAVYLTLRAIREIEDRKRWKRSDQQLADAERKQTKADLEDAAFQAQAAVILSQPLRDDGPLT